MDETPVDWKYECMVLGPRWADIPLVCMPSLRILPSSIILAGSAAMIMMRIVRSVYGAYGILLIILRVQRINTGNCGHIASGKRQKTVPRCDEWSLESCKKPIEPVVERAKARMGEAARKRAGKERKEI
eukprot:720525-Pleurochrysis_carterae.AAC.3